MTQNDRLLMGGKPRTFSSQRRQEYEDYSDRLFDLSYTTLSDLNCTAYVTKEPVTFENRFDGKEIKINKNSKWADEAFDCAWFHITGEMPEIATDKSPVFILNCGGEGLIYDRFGNEIQSVTCFAVGFGAGLGTPVKRIVPVYDELLNAGKVDFWMDCGANDLFGAMHNESRVGELCVGVENEQIRALAYDVQVLLSVIDYGRDEDFKKEITAAIEKVIAFGDITEENAVQMRTLLAELLSRQNTDLHSFEYRAIGHAHLDLAWLWPIRETKRKGARTFSTQIKNIERYPEYLFGASQAQLYQWIKDGYPNIYSKVKELYHTPNWDVQGATWVEPDSNLISGESLVRQFYYGKQFFRKEFQKDMKILWVPDSFGYSGCIPQVMKLAGVDFFLTQKMSWNVYNKFPYHTFHWKGIDGTTVLAHMLPEDTYNSPVRGDVLVQGESNYSERKISDMAMSLFGIGDGGAGPGYEHIERARRFNNLYSMPKVKYQKSDDFFNELNNSDNGYPTFEGELYLERHQGTYTTRAKNKWYNRKCEFALGNYEKLMSLAKKKGISLPVSQNEIDEIWKEILLYQFHDILPGSSINRVYEECEKRYEVIYSTLQNGITTLAKALAGNGAIINLNPFEYQTKLKIDNVWYNANIPALSFISIAAANKINDGFKNACGEDFIENDKLRVHFENGVIVQLFSKELNRDFSVNENPMAQVSQYDDNGDCWDIENCCADYITSKNDAVCTAFNTYTDGARVYAKACYEVGDCRIEQSFWLTDGESAVYCDMKLKVKQKSKMLRIAFPTNIKAKLGSFNVQFGHIERKTTENNSIDTAQFEVSAHKFVDLSEDEYGISLINDCKYGFRCKHGIIDMNLIRSPKGGPGESVDQGEYNIRYAILIHKGGLGTETYKTAYLLNNPLLITDGTSDKALIEGLYKTDNEAIVLETIKPAENEKGIIARYYNSSNKPQTAEVQLNGFKPCKVVNICEDKISDINDNILQLHPFELINIYYE